MRIWFIAASLFISLHGNSTDLFEDAVQLIKGTKVGTMHEISLMSVTDTGYCQQIPLARIYPRVLLIRFCAVT